MSFCYVSGMELSSSSIKKAFLIFQETESPKKLFIFQEIELSYISGNKKLKKLLIFLKVTFWAWKMKKLTLSKLLIFQEMEKNSCTLGLLLILSAERKLFKPKRKIFFFSFPAIVFACRNRSKLRFYEQLLILFLFWLTNQAFRTNDSLLRDKQK